MLVNTLDIKRCSWLIFFALATILRLHATHIRAGEITAVRVPNSTPIFVFTFTGFKDSGSGIPFGQGIFDFGDGQTVAPSVLTTIKIADDIEMVTFSIEHEYASPGAYIVSYREDFRNDKIINMDNSVSTAFYVESMIVIDPLLGFNNTPTFSVPPIDVAAVGATFIHTPGAFDVDGDSLSFRFTVPKMQRGIDVVNYKTLNSPEFYTNFSTGNQAGDGVPTLTIDPTLGDVVWDAPGDVLNQDDFAEYNVAFVVEEWRFVEQLGEWKRLGFVTRDMQIIVITSENEPPKLEDPDPICVEAGDTVRVTVKATDPDNDLLLLTIFEGSLSGLKAEQVGDSINIVWPTNCSHVRERPYDIKIKALDDPEFGPGLSDFTSLLVTVVAPAPEGLEVSSGTNKSITLNWDPYRCLGDDVSMQIWRREGSFEIETEDCDVGMPGNAGYQLIDVIDMGKVKAGGSSEEVKSYLDNNKGKGLQPGGVYCYRLVVSFPRPGGGLSYVSMEACDSLPIGTAILTNVDVQSTDDIDGSILVKWVPPYEIDTLEYSPPYTYDLLRGVGFEGAPPYEIVRTSTADTFFVDEGLNTKALVYNYTVITNDKNGRVVDTSASASMVKLNLRPQVQTMNLDWSASVPWSNTVQRFPYHYIYRDHVDESDQQQLVLIDSVNVTSEGMQYTDSGQFDGQVLDDKVEYCYRVETRGAYGRAILPAPLSNNSQQACAQPNDSIAPCSPPSLAFEISTCEAFVAGLACNTNVFDQRILWGVKEVDFCESEDIVQYRIYHTETGREEDYTLIGTSVLTNFTRQDITSLKGCYRVTSVDRSGNESGFSNEICMDNCPVYQFPNVFTPNGDGVNDVFGPYNNNGLGIVGFDDSLCPRFVESVVFRVFDESGRELFYYDSFENFTGSNGIYISWDGRNKVGDRLQPGIYYYVADYTVDVLDPRKRKRTAKGWVQILR